jgi:hypothetical protein
MKRLTTEIRLESIDLENLRGSSMTGDLIRKSETPGSLDGYLGYGNRADE